MSGVCRGSPACWALYRAPRPRLGMPGAGQTPHWPGLGAPGPIQTHWVKIGGQQFLSRPPRPGSEGTGCCTNCPAPPPRALGWGGALCTVKTPQAGTRGQ